MATMTNDQITRDINLMHNDFDEVCNAIRRHPEYHAESSTFGYTTRIEITGTGPNIVAQFGDNRRPDWTIGYCHMVRRDGEWVCSHISWVQ